MRSVEVAVAYTSGQWESMWVEVDNDGVWLNDEELTEQAEGLALGLAAKMKRTVSFVKVIYIDEPAEDFRS